MAHLAGEPQFAAAALHLGLATELAADLEKRPIFRAEKHDARRFILLRRVQGDNLRVHGSLLLATAADDGQHVFSHCGIEEHQGARLRRDAWGVVSAIRSLLPRNKQRQCTARRV